MPTLGVIADTHIPDRTARLHPSVLPTFRKAGVDVILHAGDILVPRVIAQLEEVAPVYAVRGNRDWIYLRNLPLVRKLSFAGVPVVLTHGHGGFWEYLRNHFYVLMRGYRPDQFVKPLLANYPDARVIVFGHSHIPFNDWVDGRLLLNPGSAYSRKKNQMTPSVAILTISAGGQISSRIIKLTTAPDAGRP